MRTTSTRSVLVALFLVALVLAGVVSFYASGSPDGLNRVAIDLGFSGAEDASVANGGPLAGYEVAWLGDPRLSGGVAGVLGCLVVLAFSTALLRIGRRRPAAVPTTGE
jgi:hypothetical protein